MQRLVLAFLLAGCAAPPPVPAVPAAPAAESATARHADALLGRDSIDLLADCMAHCPGEGLPVEAAAALSGLANGRGRAALVRALSSRRRATAKAAITGLGVPQNPTACSDLGPMLDHGDPVLRYHAIARAAALACVPGERLDEIGRTDGDDEIRLLVRTLRDGRGPTG